MSPGTTYLLLLASLAVLIVGVFQAYEGWAQRAEAVRRGRLERGLPARRGRRSAWDARLRRTWLGRSIEQRLVAAGVEVGPSDFCMILVALALAAYLVTRLLFGPALALGSAALAVFGCFRYVAYRRSRRRDEFVAQLPELARIMSNASSAGLALPRAIEIASTEIGKPASEIMQRVIDELRLGQSVDRAMENLERRMPSREVSVLVSTVVIQQRAGGDTVSALRDMADTLEERKDVRREVRTIMAGAVTTGWVVAAMGVGALLLMNLIRPGVLEDMTRVPVGRVALIAGLALYAVAFVLIRRFTKVEV